MYSFKIDTPIPLKEILSTENLAGKICRQRPNTTGRNDLANFLSQRFSEDEEYCRPFHDKMKYHMDVFKANNEEKNDYWRNMANITYPLAADAALSFFSIFNDVFPTDKIAQGTVTWAAEMPDRREM